VQLITITIIEKPTTLRTNNICDVESSADNSRPEIAIKENENIPPNIQSTALV
tara:strand:+ start:573 stop:731 length:159 start_codon:yes stop_codon:yes gene_type:complete